MSDKLPLLEEYQLKLLSYMFPINTRAALPLDLMDSNIPGYLDLGLRQNTRIYALINWTDAKKTMSLEANGEHVFEFWTQSYLGIRDGSAEFEIEPHGARIVLITSPAPITAIGVDDCLCPEIVQNFTDGELCGSFIKRGETIYLTSKNDIEVVYGGKLTLVSKEKGLYALTQNGDDLEYRVKTL